MGLGGLTRDSIIGLNNLVHDDDDNPLDNRRHSGDNLRRSWNNDSNNGSDDFLSLEGHDPLAPSESQGSFQTGLNDGLATTAAGSNAATTDPTSPARNRRQTLYNKVSATNSRSLDSYRNDNPSESSGQNSAQAVHYQGFQYEGYTDYYSEDYSDDFSYSAGSKGGKKNNIFCCLVAPWAQPKVIESKVEDQSVMSSLETEQDQIMHETGASSSRENKTVLESPASASDRVKATTPTVSQTPSPKEKFPVATSIGPGFAVMPSTPSDDTKEMESSELPNFPYSASAPKSTQTKNEPSVIFAVSESAATPVTPHMHSVGSSDSSLINSTFLADEKKQEEGDLEASDDKEEDDGPPPIKGILKIKRCSVNTSMISLSNQSINKNADRKPTPSSSHNKRQLFPTYEPKKSHTSERQGRDKAIRFNPMARVLTVPSRKEIPLQQKAQVWWQKCDYNEFKKTGRIISKAMECGGSEIWLASSNAWGKKEAQSQQIKMKKDDKSGVVKHSDSDEYNKALSKYVNEEKKDDEKSNINSDTEKWWCKFGHSRRGLEHIASSREGKARQQSVLLGIRMVMEEQKRQRATRTKDPNKLRNVAMQYTSWARDLSLAGGAADAEAVASGFHPAAACRASHFAKRLSTLTKQSDVGGGVALAVTSQILDANTHCTPRAKKSLKKSSKDINADPSCSDDPLSRRAKGYIPGGSKYVPAAALLNEMGKMGLHPTAKES